MAKPSLAPTQKGAPVPGVPIGRSRSKVPLPLAIILCLFAAALDGYEVLSELLVFLFGVGVPLVMLGTVFDVMWTFGSTMYFKLIGGSWAIDLVGSLLEWIPGLDILPLRTISVILAIVISNRSVEKDEADQ